MFPIIEERFASSTSRAKGSVPLANYTQPSTSDYGWLQQVNFQGVFSGLGDEYHGDGNSAVFAL